MQIIKNCLQFQNHTSLKHFNRQIAAFNFNSLDMFSKQTQTTMGLKKASTALYTLCSVTQISQKSNKLIINTDF